MNRDFPALSNEDASMDSIRQALASLFRIKDCPTMRDLNIEESNYPLIEYEPIPLEASNSLPEDSEMPHSSQ